MITGVAFVPAAPALVPEVGRGLDAELGPVRAACRTAIRRVAPAGTRVVVIGPADAAGEYGPTSRGSFAGFGVDLDVPLGSDEPGPLDLPPSLAVGAWLVRDALGADTGATGIAVAPDENLQFVPRPENHVALIVLGEGSARVDAKAPGYFDARSTEYNDRLSGALAHGDAGALGDPAGSTEVERDLLVVGHHVRATVAAELEATGPWDAELLHEGAPFGVAYPVAAWLRASG